MWSNTNMFLQSYFSGKISHDLLGSVEIPLKNIPASGVSIFCKINVFFWRNTIISLSIRLSLSPGEWLVESGEAWDEEAEGARRNPSHHDPQVLNCFFFTIFELSIKFRQKNLLGQDPLVQFFHAGITSPFGCVGCTILMYIGCTILIGIGCTILMRNGNSGAENNLSDSPAPRRTNNSPVKNTGWSDKQWFQL